MKFTSYFPVLRHLAYHDVVYISRKCNAEDVFFRCVRKHGDSSCAVKTCHEW